MGRCGAIAAGQRRKIPCLSGGSLLVRRQRQVTGAVGISVRVGCPCIWGEAGKKFSRWVEQFGLTWGGGSRWYSCSPLRIGGVRTRDRAGIEYDFLCFNALPPRVCSALSLCCFRPNLGQRWDVVRCDAPRDKKMRRMLSLGKNVASGNWTVELSVRGYTRKTHNAHAQAHTQTGRRRSW